jgi:hypothetical protein
MVAPPANTRNNEMDGINWNMLDLGSANLDDLDLDFATLFDPANEAESVQPQGSAWNTGTPESQVPVPGLSSAQHSLSEGPS